MNIDKKVHKEGKPQVPFTTVFLQNESTRNRAGACRTHMKDTAASKGMLRKKGKKYGRE